MNNRPISHVLFTFSLSLGVAVFRLARAMQYAGFLCEERMPDEPNETMTIVKPVGIMFAPTLGRWNHSCFPNVAIQYNRGFVYARAVKNIKPGQEITFSYVPDLYRGVGREQRMTLLKENWGFDCTCQGCTTDIIVRGEFSLALLRLVNFTFCTPFLSNSKITMNRPSSQWTKSLEILNFPYPPYL
jgi:hypothetical protein